MRAFSNVEKCCTNFVIREIVGDDGGDSFRQNCDTIVTDVIQTEIDNTKKVQFSCLYIACTHVNQNSLH